MPDTGHYGIAIMIIAAVYLLIGMPLAGSAGWRALVVLFFAVGGGLLLIAATAPAWH